MSRRALLETGVATGERALRGEPAMNIWTVGHSTRSAEEFVRLLRGYGVGAVVDVRRYPASRRLPHFNKDMLEALLRAAGIEYHWLEALGGRRRPVAESPNRAWRHDAFRGYADHLSSAEFGRGLDGLIAIGAAGPAAVMCAEALWWRCHRRLIADVLVARGHVVVHIRDERTAEVHKLTASAVVSGDRLEYPASTQSSLLDGDSDR